MPWNRVIALDALRTGDLIDLGMSANRLREKLHPEGVVTYALRPASSQNRIADDLPCDEDGSISLADFPAGEHTSLDALISILVARRAQLSGVTFRHLPVSSRHPFARDLRALTAALPSLRDTGLESIHLGLEAARPSLFSVPDLDLLLRAAAKCPLFVSASLTIGDAESLEARIDMLEMLRTLQQGSSAIQALLVRIHHAETPDARREEEATAVDYLRTLAVTRLFLDNIEHLQTDLSVMGPKVLELALRFGANDAGTVPRSQSGSKEPSHHGGESELRRIIRDAGFRPVEHDVLFRQSLLH